MIKLPDELQALVHLANQLKGEKWTYSRTTPYSRGYITGNDGRTIVQTYDGEVPANVCRYFELADPATILSIADKIQRLNATAQPVSDDRNKVRAEHAEWSQVTFGSVGPIGPLKHLSKEALEAAAAPGDLSEWADMQFLLWDAQRRAGITDEQITQAMIEKLAVNKAREWPEPKDGEPRLHIKATVPGGQDEQ